MVALHVGNWVILCVIVQWEVVILMAASVFIVEGVGILRGFALRHRDLVCNH